MNNLTFKTEADHLQNVRFEQCLLSALMNYQNAVEWLPSGFSAEVFTVDAHRYIFNAILALATKNGVYDVVLVHDELDERKQLLQAGGEKYLMNIVGIREATQASFEAYTKKLIDLSIKRKALDALDKAKASLFDGTNLSAQQVVSGAVINCLEALEVKGENEPKTLKELGKKFIARLEEGGNKAGYETGFMQLTNLLTGLYDGQLIIIAARPGEGKTTLAMNILDAVMAHSGLPAIFFSQEMPAESLHHRYLSSISGVHFESIRSNQLSEQQQIRILDKQLAMADTRNIFIDETPSRTPHDVLTLARKIKRKHGKLCAIVVDYLQIMRYPEFERDRTHEVSKLSNFLKSLAMQLQCPVIALSQMNRESTKFNRPPVLADLKESSQIEQDADIVMFLHPVRFLPPTGRGKPPEPHPVPGYTELIVAKHRNGRTGVVKLVHEGQYSRFVEYGDHHSFEGDPL